ncbi:CFEM domain-containing protein [Purpureocillium lavendulum]|uniref:CFEM domain-containing protein n=1 Tax=Purpureocillium lavendulum TaxID=1247861 RepID=A0AB34FPN5_9HYPO|nr:CFEM domain-containing protein [Purpureocillium lavendulum]
MPLWRGRQMMEAGSTAAQHGILIQNFQKKKLKQDFCGFITNTAFAAPTTTMAKSKPPSKHSRAARRATSPSIDTDKSLKEVALPIDGSSEGNDGNGSGSGNANSNIKNRPSVLAVHRAAGVSKKTSKPARKSRMTAKMRRRHERGLEMAEAVTERTGLKIERSIGRARVVDARRRAWDDINARAGEEAGRAGATASRNAFAALEDGDEDDDENEGDQAGWETDEDMGGDVPVPAGMQSSIFAPAPKAGAVPVVAPAAPAAAAAAHDDDEEIL